MKRPQFGLRLILLIVALCAVIVSWRVAVDRIRQPDRYGVRLTIQVRIAISESVLAADERMLADADLMANADPTMRQLTQDDIRELKARIAADKAELEKLSN